MTLRFVTCILSSKSTVLANILLKQINCHNNALQRFIAMINFYGTKYLRALDLLPPFTSPLDGSAQNKQSFVKNSQTVSTAW